MNNGVSAPLSFSLEAGVGWGSAAVAGDNFSCPNDADGDRWLPAAGLLWSRAVWDIGSPS